MYALPLTLSPICSLLDGSEDMCQDSHYCEGCNQIVCLTHSDGQHPAGDTDPIHTDRYGYVHRACMEFLA